MTSYGLRKNRVWMRCLAGAALAALLGLVAPASEDSASEGPESEDVVELKSGAKVKGTIVSQTDDLVTIKVQVGEKTLTRKYAAKRVHAVTRNGKRKLLNPDGKEKTSPQAPVGQRTAAEVIRLIDEVGSQPPEWFEATRLDYPQSLDLSWPKKPPSGWNNQQNVGQYIWDIINPNPGKWREGVRLMHHLLVVNKDDRATTRKIMQSLGAMYHNLLQDYARAAYWWRKSGVDRPSGKSFHRVYLAECYWRLGNKQMAVELLKKTPRKLSMIKLWADMGETREALKLAESYAKGTAAHAAYLYAGDACRIAGQLQEAIAYYEKVLAVPATGKAQGRIERNQNRARASIEGIKLFELSDVRRVADGTYRASSLGYEGQVQVEVAVKGRRIRSVTVTDHHEKQFYSALSSTPAKIIEKQSVQGVDATSSATITSEAIINATAKALAEGAQP